MRERDFIGTIIVRDTYQGAIYLETDSVKVEGESTVSVLQR